MSGYLKFNTTESSYVNGILDAIKNAGDAYHHTESWYDDDVLEESCVSSIERAANIAAKFIADLQRQLAEAKAEIEADDRNVNNLMDQVHEMSKEIEAMRPMVERYRWLRSNDQAPSITGIWYGDFTLDKAIDEARKQP